MRIKTEVLVTIATGRMVATFDDLYDGFEQLTGQLPCTHQIPRFIRELQSELLTKLPALGQSVALLNSLDELMKRHGAKDGVGLWLNSLCLDASYDVEPIAVSQQDPVEELVKLRRSS